MNRLYAVESTPTLTGAKADHRLPLQARRRSRRSRASWRPRSALRRGGAEPARPARRRRRSGSPAIAKDLQAHRGRSLVVAGEYQPAAVHALAHAMNEALGNVGTTVTYGAGVEADADRSGTRRSPSSPRAMDAGQVELLVILGGNPVFTAPADLKFAERLGKVGARRLPRPLRRRDGGPRATGTSPTRTRSSAGATRARSTAPSRSCSR